MNVCDLLPGEPCGPCVQSDPTTETVLASDSNGRITAGMTPCHGPLWAQIGLFSPLYARIGAHA